jgi:hypothetical protein
MREMAEAWALHMVGPRDAVVLVQEEALGYEAWGVYQATTFLDTGGFVLESLKQHVGVGTRAYTVALLRPRGKGEDSNWRLLPGTREPLDDVIEEAREAERRLRIGLVYWMGAHGADPLPQPPGSTRPPLQPAPALSAEELARLHHRSIDPRTGAWKWSGWEYPGQTSALSATTGVCIATGLPDPNVLLQAPGDKHLKAALTGKGMHHSAKAGLKLQDMVTLGLLDPKAP